ncbi:hypothetical protein IRJ41_014343 [Triplophysa rosa]|uniref:Uncharacterized protein n=1 Tax=Triplophysa rosa TaxID=992332 RepID=A0A9W7X3D7_TRIRA|nr:hypothetical protein IRJ41_014343 [Triplophysa rosa]
MTLYVIDFLVSFLTASVLRSRSARTFTLFMRAAYFSELKMLLWVRIRLLAETYSSCLAMALFPPSGLARRWHCPEGTWHVRTVAAICPAAHPLRLAVLRSASQH